MIRNNNYAEICSIEDSFRAGLEHSFFQNIHENIAKENNFEPVDNFSLNDDEAKSINREDFNDHQNDKENIRGGLLSTKSTCKEESQNLAIPKLLASNSHIFFSGYFGERKEDHRGDHLTNFGNDPQLTNPFAFNETDNYRKPFGKIQNSNAQVEMINVHTKILSNHHLNNFNGSLLSSSSSNGNLLRSNILSSRNATNSNSFNELVKSVSISNFTTNRNKKSKIKIFIHFIRNFVY
jgi:hypothetical protein